MYDLEQSDFPTGRSGPVGPVGPVGPIGWLDLEGATGPRPGKEIADFLETEIIDARNQPIKRVKSSTFLANLTRFFRGVWHTIHQSVNPESS